MRFSRLWTLALLVSVHSSFASAEELDWDRAKRYLGSKAIAGFAEVFKSGTQGSNWDKFWTGAGNDAIDDLKDILQGKLEDVAAVSDSDTAAAINQLRSAIDERTTRAEFEAMVQRINVEMAMFASSIADLKYRQSLADAKQEKNAQSIRELRDIQIARDKELASALKRIGLSLAEIRGRLKDLEKGLITEAADRQEADFRFGQRLDVSDGRISRLEELITPNTRRQAATTLDIDGAIAIVKRSDPVEAARVLQLSIAYDKVSNPHVDPGARYFLAIAYRRAGETLKADETIADAIVAERFREPPQWYVNVLEYFQGEDRIWLESKRTDPRFGVRAPRRVLLSQAH